MNRKWLLPFSYLYGIILYLRHWAYDKGILRSHCPDWPFVIVGNLCAGGSGKTPHTLLFARWLSEAFEPAFLSRGYGRTTVGFRIVSLNDPPALTGDEPRLFKRGFPNAAVAVCSSRVEGIAKLRAFAPSSNVILLDDAYQHRALRGGLRILLIPYSDFFHPRYLLPAGYQRDVWSRYKAADAILVTQCPNVPEGMEREQIYKQLSSFNQEHIFFSGLELGQCVSFVGAHASIPSLSENGNCSLLLVSGIARPALLEQQLRNLGLDVKHLVFPDHHDYSDADMQKIAAKLRTFASSNVRVLTTSKDREKIAPLLKKEEYSRWFSLELDLRIDREETLKKILTDYVRPHS
jgi:tetraacyldisaccharide 4'-kinase